MIRNGNVKIKRIYNGGKKIRHVYNGNRLLWSAGNIATYNVDVSSKKVYQREVEADDNCLASKYLDFEYRNVWGGWKFCGWRADREASISNLITQKVMGDEPLSLYGVYSAPVSVTYHGNGNTGGSLKAQTGERYYNNGNDKNPLFKIESGGFTKAAYAIKQWSAGSATGKTKYAPGSTQAFAASQDLYAEWAAVDGYEKNWGTLNPWGTTSNSGTTEGFSVDLTGFKKIFCSCRMQGDNVETDFNIDGKSRLHLSHGSNDAKTGTIDVSGMTGFHDLSVKWWGDNESAHIDVKMILQTS